MYAGFGVGTSLPSSLQTTPFGYAFSPYWSGQQPGLHASLQQIHHLRQLADLQQQQLQQLLQLVAQQQFSPSSHSARDDSLPVPRDHFEAAVLSSTASTSTLAQLSDNEARLTWAP